MWVVSHGYHCSLGLSLSDSGPAFGVPHAAAGCRFDCCCAHSAFSVCLALLLLAHVLHTYCQRLVWVSHCCCTPTYCALTVMFLFFYGLNIRLDFMLASASCLLTTLMPSGAGDGPTYGPRIAHCQHFSVCLTLLLFAHVLRSYYQRLACASRCCCSPTCCAFTVMLLFFE